MVTPDVRAMTARYDGFCAMAGCGAHTPKGHLIYRVNGQTLCHACGRRYVDSLPMPPLPDRPSTA
jgi:hypothetical protein